MPCCCSQSAGAQPAGFIADLPDDVAALEADALVRANPR
jgi:hypothetical protein